MFQSKNKRIINSFIKKAVSFDPTEIKKYEELYRDLRSNYKIIKPKKTGLRLLVISDTHGYLAFGKNRFANYLDTIGGFDLCVLLGDIHPAELPIILDCIPLEMIIGVKGNHDPFTIYSDYGIRDISGKSYKYKGVTFAGIEGSFRYKDAQFPSYTQYESLLLAQTLPQADVLLTHDVLLDNFECEPAHAGLIGITQYIYSNRVQWHFHGHIHHSYHKQYENGTNEKSIYLCEYVEI